MASFRALMALPILLPTFFMIRAGASLGPPLPTIFQPMQEAGFYTGGDVSVELLSSFYGPLVPGLDDALARITVAFAQLQMWPADQRAWWQSFTLVVEWAGVYAILMLEGSRRGNKGSVFQYPFLLAFFGQFIAIGSLSPIWFYAFYLAKGSGPSCRKGDAAAALDKARAGAVLPTIVMAYLVPSVVSYLHPSYESRHWWNWIWQLYPIWGSLAHLVFSKVMPAPKNTKATVRVTMCLIAAATTANFWYLRLRAPFSWAEVFVPAWDAAGGALDDRFYLRTLLQWDYACYTGAALMWLAYSCASLKTTGACRVSWVGLFVGAAVVGLLGGLGTMIVVGWLVREEMLSGRAGNKSEKSS